MKETIRLTNIYNSGGLAYLESILRIIRIHRCETVEQVEGLINNKIDELKGRQGE